MYINLVLGQRLHCESTGFQECVTKRGLLEISALSEHCPLQKLPKKFLIASEFTFFSLQRCKLVISSNFL